MEEPSPDDLAVLALTERELFSLYAQYPEIDFNPESPQKMAAFSEHFSSPASNTGNCDEFTSVEASNSTRHTTPVKHDMFEADTDDGDEYTSFCSHLQRCDLPPQTTRYLKSIGSACTHLGCCIINEDVGEPAHITETVDSLLPQLQYSSSRIKEEIATIDYITELASFNIFPTDISLWSNYRQRAALVSEHLSCPSQTEVRLLHQLLHVFDAYVYHPYLQLRLQDAKPFDSSMETTLEDTINALYDALMTLLSTYQKWLRTMRDFKLKYMTPIMRRIQDSPWIQREIEQMESTYEAAGETLSKLQASVVASKLQQDQVLAAARMAERRAKSSGPKVSARTKTRFKGNIPYEVANSEMLQELAFS